MASKQVTFSGIDGEIFNGVSDWTYESMSVVKEIIIHYLLAITFILLMFIDVINNY